MICTSEEFPNAFILFEVHNKSVERYIYRCFLFYYYYYLLAFDGIAVVRDRSLPFAALKVGCCSQEIRSIDTFRNPSTPGDIGLAESHRGR